MYSYQTRLKKNIKIIKSITKIGLVSFGLFAFLSLNNIQGTSSFFGDFEEMSGNKFTAGYWIPTLKMSVDKEPDEDENYDETPCVILSADINGKTSGITIYYKFSNDGNPVSDGIVYTDVCVPIPDGDPSYFEAQAVNDENQNWVSNLISESFKVDTVNIKEGDVIINEVMWMGSQDDDGDEDSTDEWLELRNTTNHDIDIKNWNIYGTKKGGHYEISGGPTVIIPANGYFLITNKSKNKSRVDVEPDRSNDNLDFEDDYTNHQPIILKDTEDNIIDQTPANDSSWPAGEKEEDEDGDNNKRWSMERDEDDPGNGTEKYDWHTCNPTTMSSSDLEEMEDYWDNDAQDYNCGTPGHKNLSKDDETGSGESADKIDELLESLGGSNFQNPVRAIEPLSAVEEVKNKFEIIEVVKDETVDEDPVGGDSESIVKEEEIAKEEANLQEIKSDVEITNE